ncbi:MAG: aminomethyltransferase family protein, partial [Salinibacterium sp.]|nr:aminomethyltransferase family protein [Salinibacterium sp.]
SRSVLESAGELIGGNPADVDTATQWSIRTSSGDVRLIADHRRQTGELGYELSVPTERAQDVASALYATAGWGAADPYEPRDQTEDHYPDVRIRPIGWHAFNTARIEAGLPLYYLDFGPEHLPHESGIVDRRVRFDKGCYLGQEIVARMQSLGHPKQKIVSLDLSLEGVPEAQTPQPTQGAAVLADVDDARETVGVVTSSSISPMLGGRPICFAMVRWQHAQPGQQVSVTADGDILTGVVRDRLAYWPVER